MKPFVIGFFVATAQTPPPPSPVPFFPADLKQYFSLSDSQVSVIIQLNADYNRLAASKQQRMFEVQREISEETAKEMLDPVGLGLRYVELEVIRRELRDALVTLRGKIA